MSDLVFFEPEEVPPDIRDIVGGPCPWIPGSDDRVSCYAARYALGLPIWNEHDAKNHELQFIPGELEGTYGGRMSERPTLSLRVPQRRTKRLGG